MANANTTHNILIIDDVPNNIKILANILNCEKYKIFIATNGRNALSKIENTPFELIILLLLNQFQSEKVLVRIDRHLQLRSAQKSLRASNLFLQLDTCI